MSTPLIGTTLGKRYELQQRLQQTAIYDVYVALDQQTNQTVLAQLFNDHYASNAAFQDRFARDMQRIAPLQHKAILPVLDYQIQGGYVYIITETAAGGTLQSYLERATGANRLSAAEVMRAVLQLAQGLQYAHQQNVHHRDLKPANIVVDEAGDGLSLLFKGFEIFSMVQIGTDKSLQDTSGDPNYLAPEQINANRFDKRSDIYSLGVVLYEMLAGKPPYQANTRQQMLQQHHQPLPDIRQHSTNINAELEQVVRKSLDKNPDNRYQSAGALAQALTRAIQAANPAPPRPEEPKPAPPTAPAPATPAPRPSVEAELIIKQAGQIVERIRLNRSQITLGRSADQDVVLEDTSKRVSRSHLVIRGSATPYTVEDQKSGNGTLLDGKKLAPQKPYPWQIGQVITVGPYQLELKEYAATSAAPPVSAPAPVTSPPRIAQSPAPGPVAGVDVIKVVQPPPANVVIQPNQPQQVAIELQNKSAIVDWFEVRLGESAQIPSAWFQFSEQPIQLMPEGVGAISIMLRPPRQMDVAAGTYQIPLVATARENGSQKQLGTLTMQIAPFHEHAVELYPAEIRRGRRAILTIQNNGNAPDNYAISGQDRGDELIIKPEADYVTLVAGETRKIPLRIHPRFPQLTGSSHDTQFSVIVEPEAGTKLPDQKGTFRVHPRISRTVMGIVAVVLFGGTVSAGTLLSRAQTAFQQTQVAIERTTSAEETLAAALRITETASADLDEDDLSYSEELEIGTVPDNPDSDGDGLADGFEVDENGSNTNPLEPDTDRDELLDGTEWAMGFCYNPNNPITIGEEPDRLRFDRGVQCNQPTATPTPTATHTPTITPTAVPPNPDACVGSPPTRLSVGMQARVTTGEAGEENLGARLRTEARIAAETYKDTLRDSTPFLIVGGPACDPDQSLRFWEIRIGTDTAWIAEGNCLDSADEDRYYIEPLADIAPFACP